MQAQHDSGCDRYTLGSGIREGVLIDVLPRLLPGCSPFEDRDFSLIDTTGGSGHSRSVVNDCGLRRTSLLKVGIQHASRMKLVTKSLTAGKVCLGLYIIAKSHRAKVVAGKSSLVVLHI